MFDYGQISYSPELFVNNLSSVQIRNLKVQGFEYLASSKLFNSFFFV